MNKIRLYIWQYLFCLNGYIFLDLAFPGLGFWKRLCVFICFMCLYGFMKTTEKIFKHD